MDRRLFFKSLTAVGVGFLAGCGSSPGFVGVATGTNLVDLDPSAIQLLQRILPECTDEVRLEGYNEAGERVFGPQTLNLNPNGSLILDIPEDLSVSAESGRQSSEIVLLKTESSESSM